MKRNWGLIAPWKDRYPGQAFLMSHPLFAYTSTTYDHPFKDRWTVGPVSFELDDLAEEDDAKQEILGLIKGSNKFVCVFNEFFVEKLPGAVEPWRIVKKTDKGYYIKIYSKIVESKFLPIVCIVNDEDITKNDDSIKYICIFNNTPEYIEYTHMVPSKKCYITEKKMLNFVKSKFDKEISELRNCSNRFSEEKINNMLKQKNSIISDNLEKYRQQLLSRLNGRQKCGKIKITQIDKERITYYELIPSNKIYRAEIKEEYKAEIAEILNGESLDPYKEGRMENYTYSEGYGDFGYYENDRIERENERKRKIARERNEIREKELEKLLKRRKYRKK